mgnify:CR=1 FL=1
MNPKILKCLDELYKNSNPPISWEALEEQYGGTPINFYEVHTIPHEKYQEIVDKHKQDMRQWEAKRLNFALLNYGPREIYDEQDN